MPVATRPNLALRLITAAVGLPALFLVLLAGGNWVAGAAAVAALIGSHEALSLQRRAGWRPLVGQGAGWGGVLAGAAILSESAVLVALLSGIVVLAVASTALRRSTEAFGDWVLTIAGTCYVSLPLATVVLIRISDGGLQWIAVAFLATFATDTSAYVTGKVAGRHKMAPTISPGKTWEGAIGGLIGGTAATMGLVWLMTTSVYRVEAAVALGIAIAVFAMAGDLFESKLKRLANAKDSGVLLPGHGGVLDRLDSLVPVFPLVYYASRVWPVF